MEVDVYKLSTRNEDDEELRNDTNESAGMKNKAKVKAYHDRNIERKTFKVGQQVLLYNSCLLLCLGKLRSHWRGPYEVVYVYPNGSVDVRDLEDGHVFKVKGQRLKPYVDDSVK